jgi:preprotein translocase subunit YajC
MFTNFSWLMDAVTSAPAAVAEAAATAAPEEAGGPLAFAIQLLPMVAIVAVFWFVMIRPQRKKDKAVKDMLSALKPGDRVCTIGGVYGTVTSIKDDTVTIVVGTQKTQMVLARWGIRSVEDAPLENDVEPQV